MKAFTPKMRAPETLKTIEPPHSHLCTLRSLDSHRLVHGDSPPLFPKEQATLGSFCVGQLQAEIWRAGQMVESARYYYAVHLQNESLGAPVYRTVHA